MTRYATCPECGRVFDLYDESDADEWANGHDCEIVTEAENRALWGDR